VSVQIENTNADTGGDVLRFYKNSASPASGDSLGYLMFTGKDSMGATQEFSSLRVSGDDITDGSEDASWHIYNRVAGTETEVFTIASGNVGIGTTGPITKLTTAGDMNLKAASAGNSYKLYFGDEVTSGPGKAIFMEGYYMKIQGHRNEGIRLQGVDASGNVQEFATFYGDANAKASQIHLAPSTGNVGIGTTNPGQKLEVRQGTIFSNMDGTTAAQTHIQFGNANGVIGSITTSGTATAYNTSSDRRLKENITTTTAGLATLMRIPVNDFNFVSDPSKRMQGFIAQDLYNYYPEAVNVGGDDPAKNPWSVDYGRITPLLVKGIQEQQNQMQEQQKQLQKQQREIENLKAELAGSTTLLFEAINTLKAQTKELEGLTAEIASLKRKL